MMTSRKGIAYGTLACVFTSISVAVAFFLIALRMGVYGLVDMLGGTIFVFILSMIVSFSIIPEQVAKRTKGTGRAKDSGG